LIYKSYSYLLPARTTPCACGYVYYKKKKLSTHETWREAKRQIEREGYEDQRNDSLIEMGKSSRAERNRPRRSSYTRWERRERDRQTEKPRGPRAASGQGGSLGSVDSFLRLFTQRRQVVVS
jgi:hypothetical protein